MSNNKKILYKKGDILKYYDSNSDNLKKIIKEELDTFLVSFPKELLWDFTLDDYCLWIEDSANSFSYALEWWTHNLWSVKWWSSRKYWIYYSEKNEEYYFWKRFKDELDWLDKINKVLKKISKIKNIKELNKELNIINGTVVFSDLIFHKICYLYNPTELLPIYSFDNLKKFALDNWIEDIQDKTYFELNFELLNKLYEDNFLNSEIRTRDKVLSIMWFLYNKDNDKKENIERKSLWFYIEKVKEVVWEEEFTFDEIFDKLKLKLKDEEKLELKDEEKVYIRISLRRLNYKLLDSWKYRKKTEEEINKEIEERRKRISNSTRVEQSNKVELMIKDRKKILNVKAYLYFWLALIIFCSIIKTNISLYLSWDNITFEKFKEYFLWKWIFLLFIEFLLMYIAYFFFDLWKKYLKISEIYSSYELLSNMESYFWKYIIKNTKWSEDMDFRKHNIEKLFWIDLIVKWVFDSKDNMNWENPSSKILEEISKSSK